MPRDPVSKHLKKAIARARAPKVIDVRKLVPFIDPNAPLPPPLQRAFADFGLDPQKLSDWAHLTVELACVLYGRGNAGRPKKLPGYGLKDYERAIKLLMDIQAIKRRQPKATDEVIASELGMGLVTFRRRRRDATQAFRPVVKISTPN